MKLFRPRFNQREGTPDAMLAPNPVRRYASCDCLKAQYEAQEWQELSFHTETQDTHSDAWSALQEYIRAVDAHGDDEFNPISGIGPERWEQILTLPPSIGTLKSVKFISVYGSHLVRIPPEVGEMSNLEEFDVYTSMCLHWFPYELRQCKRLKRSRVSTRALYGNYKYRPPFPQLPTALPDSNPSCCSVCRTPFAGGEAHQVWISLPVATDVLPLLVHACSEECIQKLPTPPRGYVQEPHRGGLRLKQPHD